MPAAEYYSQVQALQQRLHEAKKQGETKLEIEALMQIGRLAASEQDHSTANMHFGLAARVIRDSNIGLEKLHEALGARALILRRAKRFQESLDLYGQAAAAAQEHAGPMEYAHWVGKQGGIHRLMGNPDLARQAFEKALELFSGLGKEGLAGVADQEGNLGLLASDRRDYEAAEEAYRCAVEVATAAGSPGLINTWATNLGNALSRRRYYHEAWTFYEQALAAALQSGEEGRIASTATEWGVSYRAAHRWQQAAETLLNAAALVKRPAAKCGLLEEAMGDLRVAGAWEKLQEVGAEVSALLQEHKADPARLDRCRSLVDFARQSLEEKGRASPAAPGGPTTLDIFISNSMARYEKSGDAQGMRQVAHLVCDVSLGLLNPTEAAWQPLLSQTFLRYRVLGDAMKALCQAGLAEQSLELSLRIKSLGFCLPNIERLRQAGAPHEEAAAYLESMEKLSQAVAALKGPATPDGPQRVSAVRAAGEMVLECGEKLRDRDRILHARLGGLIRPQDVLDALPLFDPAAIVDLFVTQDGTVIHILVRRGNSVRVVPIFATSFSAEHARALLMAWAKGNITHEISERQRQGLIEIGKILHDRLFCGLAKHLIELKVGQVTLIPDILTGYLPLHLSFVCSEDINIPGVDTTGAQLFGEVFPVEYAPCMQAVAISQHQKRPREVAAVLSLADSMSDLPGARSTSGWLASRLPKTLEYTSHVGEEATLANLSSGIDKADIVVIGTHGVFDSAHPIESHLVLYDGHWAMSDILDRPPFATGPVFVLSACEVGASGPGAELTTGFPSGIPGALLSGGVACVLASLWPVEDISMGYIVERFITHLSHRGYRPAAALFRAFRDLRRLTREEVIERFDTLLDQMKQDGSRDRLPEQFSRLYELKVMIEDSEDEHPFASAQFWGGIVIVGSGWHLPAGAAMVGNQPDVPITAMLEREKARSLIARGQFREAQDILKEMLDYVEGMDRARALELLAMATWGIRRKLCPQAARREAMKLLAQAEFVARAEQDQQLLRNIEATRKKIEIWKDKTEPKTKPRRGK